MPNHLTVINLVNNRSTTEAASMNVAGYFGKEQERSAR